MYLIRNASGQKTYPRFTNHFNPTSVIFDKRHFRQIIASDIGIALLFGALGTWGYQRGFTEVVKYYLIPYRASPTSHDPRTRCFEADFIPFPHSIQSGLTTGSSRSRSSSTPTRSSPTTRAFPSRLRLLLRRADAHTRQLPSCSNDTWTFATVSLLPTLAE